MHRNIPGSIGAYYNIQHIENSDDVVSMLISCKMHEKMKSDVSPKRQRTSDILIPEEDIPYMGTPDKLSGSPPPTRNPDSDPNSPVRAQPTPIRMGMVRQSIANFTRATVNTPMGKAAPPALPPVTGPKAKAPGLPPGVPKKAAPPLPQAVTARPLVNLPQLRPLFWQTFPPPSDRACVWDDVDISVTGLSELVKQSESKLVSLFAYKKDTRAAAKTLENLPRSNEPVGRAAAVQPSIVMNGKRLMKVLDDRKTQNLAIALRRFPDPEAVMEAIVTVDTAKLSGDQVALLLQEFPSPDICAEIERVENSHGEEEDHLFEWDRPEQYLLVMACIHNCRHILTVWSFAVNHHNRIDGDCGDESLLATSASGSSARQQLSDFIAACESISNSTALRVFLATVREVGNRMNLNTPRGCARGVSVESILQFDDLKSSGSGSVSLFSVVVEIWLSKNAENLTELQTQLGRVRKLRIPSIQEIEVDLNKQSEVAKRATASLRTYYQELEEEASVVIADKLKVLSDPVMKQIKGNAELLAKAKVSWTKCLSYFCIKSDSPLTKNSNEFFDHWKKITKMIEKYVPAR